MSELSLIEIVAAPIRTIGTTMERKRVMGEKITVYMQGISQNVSSLRPNQRSLDLQTHQSPGSLLNRAKPLTVNRGDAADILDTGKKLASTVYALSNAPELHELYSEVKLKIPNLDGLVTETNYFLKTGNVDALRVKTPEINKGFKKMLGVLQSKQRLMEKEEIKTTSLLIRDSLKEIGFGSIKEISGKCGGRIVRAVDKKSLTSVFAEINAGEGIKVDTKGFVGAECTKTVDALVDKLKEKGIEAKKKNRVFHNKTDGGELVKTVEPLFNPLESDAGSSRRKAADRMRRLKQSRKRQRTK